MPARSAMWPASGSLRLEVLGVEARKHSLSGADARLPKARPAQFGEMVTPHGASPTAMDFTTVRLGTSITDTSLLLPLVTNKSLSSGVKASCHTL